MDESEQQADSAREGRVCLGGSLASAGDAAPFRNDTGDFYGRLLSAQLGERDNSKHLAACYFLPDSQDCLEKPFQAFGKGSGSGATGTFSTGPASELQPASTRASASLWAFAAGDRAEPPGSGPGRCSSDRPCADAEPVHRPRCGPGFGGRRVPEGHHGFRASDVCEAADAGGSSARLADLCGLAAAAEPLLQQHHILRFRPHQWLRQRRS